MHSQVRCYGRGSCSASAHDCCSQLHTLVRPRCTSSYAARACGVRMPRTFPSRSAPSHTGWASITKRGGSDRTETLSKRSKPTYSCVTRSSVQHGCWASIEAMSEADMPSPRSRSSRSNRDLTRATPTGCGFPLLLLLWCLSLFTISILTILTIISIITITIVITILSSISIITNIIGWSACPRCRASRAQRGPPRPPPAPSNMIWYNIT